MEPSSLRTPAEPGACEGPGHVPPPAKKQRTADDPTPLSRGGQEVAAAGDEAAAAASGQELTRGNGAKMKKKRKTFIYGNYDAYYGYRSGPRGAPEQRDPRLALLQRAWFEGRRVLDIGCNSGVITFAMAEHFAPRSILGVDIDGHLVSRALKRLARLRSEDTAPAHPGDGAVAGADSAAAPGFPHNIDFRAENYVARKHRRHGRQRKAAKAAAPGTEGAGGGGKPLAPERYDVILCLSVTKWIHLNWGDVRPSRPKPCPHPSLRGALQSMDHGCCCRPGSRRCSGACGRACRPTAPGCLCWSRSRGPRTGRSTA